MLKVKLEKENWAEASILVITVGIINLIECIITRETDLRAWVRDYLVFVN